MDAALDAGVAPVATPTVPAAVTVIPYHHEDPLFWISVYVAGSLWLVLLIVSFGLVIPLVLLMGLLGLFTHSLLIAWVRGNAVRVSADQFPDLHRHFVYSCQRLGVQKMPELYLCQADGMLNALAVRFMRRNYVVLLSNVVDALDGRPEAIKFYMGHELAHIQRKHLTRHWWLAPAGLTPLLAPAYARACEYTCDRHGLACCDSLEDAQRALVVLAAGSERWKNLNLAAFEAQSAETGRFWMAVNELTSDYPWLCKRLARLKDRDARFPRRSAWAWLIAAFSPRMGYGGAVVGFIYLLIMAGVILALVLALTLSGSGIGDKIEQLREQVYSELGLGAVQDKTEAEATGSDAGTADTAVTPAEAPVTGAELQAIGQVVARALDDQVETAGGRFPATLGDVEGLEERLSAVAQGRWQNVGFDYQAPKESVSRLAELTLTTVCSECGEESLVLHYQRQAGGRWSCATTGAVAAVSIAACPTSAR